MQSYWMQAGPGGVALDKRDVPVPHPGPRQLLVRLHAASLNRGEFLAGRDAGGAPTAWKPAGWEGAGEVAQAGAGITGWRTGDRVMGRCNGAFAEYALMEADEAMALPPNLSWEEGAAIPLTFLLAFDMLVLQGRLKTGEWLLVNGVSSGVGVASLQMGKALGARVIGTSGSPDKLARLEAMGLDVAVAVRGPGFADAVLRATGDRGVDLVVNAIGGTVFAEDLRVLAFEGRLAMVGTVDGMPKAEIDLDALHRKRLVLFGVSNKLRSHAQRAGAVPAFVADVLPHFASERIRPHIDQVFDFDALPQARQRMEAGGHVGKIVLRMP